MGKQSRRASRAATSTRNDIRPQDAAAALRHFRSAVERFAAGDASRAATELDAVLRIMPDNADARCLRGAAANHLGEPADAITHLERGLPGLGAISHDTRDAHNEYAVALRAVGRHDDSERVLVELTTAQPDYTAAWHNLALSLDALERHDEAVAAARRATLLAPGDAGALLLLGKLLRRQGRLLSAAAALRRAYALAPDDPTVNTVLGNTLFYLGEIEPSVACFERAAALAPDSASMHTNVGTMLSAAGRHDDALAAHERALAIEPLNPEVVVRRAATLLNLGRIVEGWHAFDGRLRTHPKARRWIGTPTWDGSDLADGTLLVHREQGIGDEIMFASCYPDLIECAGRLVIECDPRVEALFRRSFPAATVDVHSDAGEPPDDLDDPTAQLPVHPRADQVIAAGSVPQYLRRSIDAFPVRDSYLAADPDETDTFGERLAAAGDGPYVGISWRSMIRTAERRLEYTRLDEWAPILRTPGVTFVLLQYDQCERDVADAEARFGVHIARWRDLDLKDELDRVAALVSCLDLVIAPRNAVTMLAGALGTPTLAIGNLGDWSECGTGQLPWFTSVECLNREVGHDWGAVLAEAAHRVRALAEGRPALQSIHQRKATV